VFVVSAGFVFFVGAGVDVLFILLLDFFVFPAGVSALGGVFVDVFFEAFFFARRIKYEQAFVSFHCSFLSSAGPSMVPLNWFIAFCMPSLSQHSAWSEATAKTLSASWASVELNRPSTWPVISLGPAVRPIPIRRRA